MDYTAASPEPAFEEHFLLLAQDDMQSFSPGSQKNINRFSQ